MIYSRACPAYHSINTLHCLCRGGSRLIGKGVSVNRCHMSFYLRTGGGARDGTTHMSFYLQKG